MSHDVLVGTVFQSRLDETVTYMWSWDDKFWGPHFFLSRGRAGSMKTHFPSEPEADFPGPLVNASLASWEPSGTWQTNVGE